MRVTLITLLAAIALVVLNTWLWARLGWHRAQAMHFGPNTCVDLEVRPRGFHVSVSPYDRGFPTSMQQQRGWTFMHTINPPPNDQFITPKARFLGFGFDVTDRDQLYGGPAHFVNVPYWMVLVLVSALMLQRSRHRLDVRQ